MQVLVESPRKNRALTWCGPECVNYLSHIHLECKIAKSPKISKKTVETKSL